MDIVIIASNLGKWLSLVDTIDDDIYKWLKTSVEVIEESVDSHFFYKISLQTRYENTY